MSIAQKNCQIFCFFSSVDFVDTDLGYVGIYQTSMDTVKNLLKFFSVNLARIKYHCNWRPGLSGGRDKEDTGLCLQINFKITLSQFHLTYQRCTLKRKVCGIQNVLETFFGHCAFNTGNSANYEV